MMHDLESLSIENIAAGLMALGSLFVCIHTRRVVDARESVWALRLAPLVFSFSIYFRAWGFPMVLSVGLLAYVVVVCCARWKFRTPGSAVVWALKTAGRAVAFALPVIFLPFALLSIFMAVCFALVVGGVMIQDASKTPEEVRADATWHVSETNEIVPFSVGFLSNNERSPSYDRKVVFKSGKFFGIEEGRARDESLSVYGMTADTYALEDGDGQLIIVNVADETVCAWRLNKWIRMPENMYMCGFNRKLQTKTISPDLQNPQAEERPFEDVQASLTPEEMVGLRRKRLLGTIDARGCFKAAK